MVLVHRKFIIELQGVSEDEATKLSRLFTQALTENVPTYSDRQARERAKNAALIAERVAYEQFAKQLTKVLGADEAAEILVRMEESK